VTSDEEKAARTVTAFAFMTKSHHSSLITAFMTKSRHSSLVTHHCFYEAGFRCLWGQRIDPASGRLIGGPYLVRHFHNPMLQQYSTSFGNAIPADGFLYGGRRFPGNLWRLLPPAGATR
jgi:hypothetical protein